MVRYENFIVFLLALMLSLGLTPVVIAVSRAAGFAEKPREDRWHRREVAKMGGIAMYLGFIIPALLLAEKSREFWGLMLGTTMIFFIGLIDDFINIKPQFKLMGQIITALTMVYFGISFGYIFLTHPFITIPLSVFWIVGICNAFNLLDNIDGLAAGIAAITAFTIVASSVLSGSDKAVTLAIILGSSALGFLAFNFNPAKIFMGDCGSMFLGTAMAGITIIGTSEHTVNLLVIISIPILLLGVPIFDTSLVTFSRFFRGKRISQGGKDHSSHRLVALGLSERKAVLFLYGISILFGLIAVSSIYFNLNIYIIGVVSVLLVTTVVLFGIFLGNVNIYERRSAEEVKEEKSKGLILDSFILYKRRMVEIVMDFLLVCAAHFAAYLLRYGGVIDELNREVIMYSLPVVIIIKLGIFNLVGFYRGVWKYIGLYDLITIAKGIFYSSAVCVAVLSLVYRFENFSRAVFIMDALLCLIFLAGSRILLRIFRESFLKFRNGGKRLLLIGAGDAGELILREIRNNAQMNYVPVAFVDDDRRKIGRKVHGLPILGNRDRIAEIVGTRNIEEIIVAIPSAPAEEVDRIKEICVSTGVKVRTVKHIHTAIDFETQG